MTRVGSARRLAMLSSVVAVASVCAVLATPLAASAAATATSNGIELSNDGVTYDAQLSAPLYGADLRVIPQSSHDSAFWVRNDSTEVGYLRIVLSDVTGSNADLLGALSLRADTPSTVGTPAALTSAQPCRVVTQGSVLAPGDSIRIDTALAVADLTGSAGQNGTVAFRLQVGMSSVDPAGTPATTCVLAGTTVPVFPPTTTDPTTTPVAQGASGTTAAPLGRGVARTSTAGSAPVSPTTPVAGREGLAPMPYPFVLFQLTNSLRLFQEDIVFLWVMSAMIGALCVLIITRRRRRADDKNGAVE